MTANHSANQYTGRQQLSMCPQGERAACRVPRASFVRRRLPMRFEFPLWLPAGSGPRPRSRTWYGGPRREVIDHVAARGPRAHGWYTPHPTAASDL